MFPNENGAFYATTNTNEHLLDIHHPIQKKGQRKGGERNKRCLYLAPTGNSIGKLTKRVVTPSCLGHHSYYSQQIS